MSKKITIQIDPRKLILLIDDGGFLGAHCLVCGKSGNLEGELGLSYKDRKGAGDKLVHKKNCPVGNHIDGIVPEPILPQILNIEDLLKSIRALTSILKIKNNLYERIDRGIMLNLPSNLSEYPTPEEIDFINAGIKGKVFINIYGCTYRLIHC